MKETKIHLLDLPDDIRVSLNNNFRDKIFNLIKSKYSSTHEFAKNSGFNCRLLTSWKYENNYIPLSFLKYITKDLDVQPTDVEENVKFLASKARIKIKLPFVMDKEIAWLLGFLVTDGHIPNNLMYIEFANKNVDLLKEAARVTSTHFIGCEKYIEFLKRERVTLALIHSKIIASILSCFVPTGKKFDIVKVPQFIFKSPRDVIESFLQGVFDGDGHPSFNEKKYSRTIVLHSFSYSLIKDVHKLLEKLGINSHIYELTENGHCVQIGGYSNIFQFLKLVNFKHKIRKKKLNLMVSSYKQFQKPSGKANDIALEVIEKIQPCTSFDFAKRYGCSLNRAQIILQRLFKNNLVKRRRLGISFVYMKSKQSSNTS